MLILKAKQDVFFTLLTKSIDSSSEAYWSLENFLCNQSEQQVTTPSLKEYIIIIGAKCLDCMHVHTS